MRKIVVISHISLDGVLQAMGGSEEDTSGGFAHGGWVAPYSDEVLGAVIRREMDMPFELLIGRKTFDIWSPYWPQHGDIWANVNTTTKYVASNTVTASEWQPTVFLSGDVASKVRQLKQEHGADLHVYGSGNLIQTLLAHDLVDALWLKVYPLTLGRGKRLFDGGSIPVGFKLTESKASPSGVLIANYERVARMPDRR
jgi:dihydrofolate reductase